MKEDNEREKSRMVVINSERKIIEMRRENWRQERSRNGMKVKSESAEEAIGEYCKNKKKRGGCVQNRERGRGRERLKNRRKRGKTRQIE